MSSIEATPAPGEAARPPVPVTHPRWCDRSRCTAPEFVPTAVKEDNREKSAGAHRSANLADWGAHVGMGTRREIYLEKDVLSSPTSTWLMVGDSMILIDYESPVLWALLDERDEIAAQYPGLMEGARAGAEERVAKLRAKEARRGASE